MQPQRELAAYANTERSVSLGSEPPAGWRGVAIPAAWRLLYTAKALRGLRCIFRLYSTYSGGLG